VTSKVITVLVAFTVSYLTFRNVDWRAAFVSIRSVGASACWLLVPSLVAVLAEARAWQSSVRVFAGRPSTLRLAHVRVVTESLGTVLPFGALWAEAVKPYLLRRHCGFSLAHSLTAIAARKYLLVITQGAYVLIGLALGYHALARASQSLAGSTVLLWLVPLSALLLLCVGEGMALSLGGGRALSRVLDALSEIRIDRLRGALARVRRDFERTDEHAVRFFGTTQRLALGPLALTLLGWMMEALETWLILSLLGQDLDFGSALAVEATVVFVRHLLFMLPAGLGAQELGYAALFGALGVGLEASAAFALLKRGRELVWAAAGYLLFLADTANANRATRGRAPLPAH
jgi:uncharacterized protein (TIRG00374 family)